MKKSMLSISSAMLLILLIASVIYYQKANALTQPELPGLHKAHPIPEEQQNEADQSEALQPFNQDDITYTLQNDELNISFNQGADWVNVPVEKNQLFGGEYNGSEQELIADSYLLTENLAAFLHVDGWDRENEKAVLTYSADQGKTWEKSVIADPLIGMRFRKIDFLNEDFGYVILSGGRTMSQEYSAAFLTYDGGESWEETTNTEHTRLIADGGFVDETTGFLSYGTINPEAPDLYVTHDGGQSWEESMIDIPAKYEHVFVMAETPIKEADHLSLLIHQGPNGDYAGGHVKGKFISTDDGATWKFDREVELNEME